MEVVLFKLLWEAFRRTGKGEPGLSKPAPDEGFPSAGLTGH